ncbi:MAG: ActS/PrrB/RegB family redox-sensitive histidine kinase [Geminicoccaceae bacterium]|nr:ActS/PrrB/RegB family redox-sensitive histidine kinase [Geminicoccaceae bacterium]
MTNNRSTPFPDGFDQLVHDLVDTFATDDSRGDNIGRNISIVTLAIIRWVAIIGQLFTILFVHFSLGINVSPQWLLPLVGASVLVNVALMRQRRLGTRLSQRRTLLVFGFDIVQLGMLLGLTGGLSNPFSMLLLLPVTLASTTLTRGGALLLAGITLIIIAILAGVPGGLPWVTGPLELPRLYTTAVWLALSLAVGLFAWHMAQITDDARRQESAFSAVQAALAREQQLSALGGQAAAVAHALGTPLATINVIAKELVRELPGDDPLAVDANELLEQARRCRQVLSTLGRPQSDRSHQLFTASPLSDQLREIFEQCERPPIELRMNLEIGDGFADPIICLAAEIRHALTNLIENAVSFAETEVFLTLKIANDGTSLVIEDDGAGFDPEILDRLGEPYNTGRPLSGGLGLGVFIANSLLARTGAKLHFENSKKGARVRIHWPISASIGELENSA